ncbi:hypothetical protein P4B35_17495 [Pontiellaceae bacterium B12227]|nr:hypothetical protein [Pontiellaceae bacterium B12227]
MKFESIPTDTNTHIILSLECELDSFDVLYQRWSYEGILAESFIFLEADLSSMNDEMLETLARKSPMIEANSKITIRRSVDGFAFVNFNFKIFDEEVDFDGENSAISLV